MTNPIDSNDIQTLTHRQETACAMSWIDPTWSGEKYEQYKKLAEEKGSDFKLSIRELTGLMTLENKKSRFDVCETTRLHIEYGFNKEALESVVGHRLDPSLSIIAGILPQFSRD